jgi:PAS domain S-box-containing protein
MPDPRTDSNIDDGRSSEIVELLRLAVEKAPQGVLVLDESGTIVAANQSATVLFGYGSGELVGRAVEELVPELNRSNPPTLWTELGAALRAHERGATQVMAGIRKDGVSVPIEVGRSVTTAGSSRFGVVSIADLTELMHMKARLMAATHAHLGFQRLVADIALQFAAAESAALDDLITSTLGQIGEALQLDRASLWRKNEGESTAAPTHSWIRRHHPANPASIPIASIPYVVSRLEAGETVSFSRVDDIPDPIDRETFRQNGPRSAAIIPLAIGEPGVLCALAFSSTTAEQDWVSAILERLRLIAGVIGQALARRTSEASLAVALDEIHRLRDRLDQPSPIRRDSLISKASRLIVAESAAVKRAVAQVEQVAMTPATVLLRGETGTGKEVFAQAIHDLSPRHQRPMVTVSCAAIPTALIESELFGRERGAYTGALSRQIGRFEAANQSTLFLDEIGELPMEMQVKLLRVLQERTIERLGSTQPIKVDVRIIAATHRDLEAAVQDGTFREDLFYRLNVFPIVVPPLRERIEDIPGLVWAFVDEFSRAFGRTIDSIPKSNLRELESYPWPGNVRELRNVIERAVILSTGRQLVIPVPRQAGRMPQTAMTLEALEIDHIRKVLESTNWRVRGAGGAAERLGLKPTTLESRMARLGISRKQVS